MHVVLALLILVGFGCGTSDSHKQPATAPTTPQPAHAASHSGAEPEHAHHGHGEHAGPIGHRFEKADEWVERFEGSDRDEWQKPDVVIATLQLRPGMSVADIGAGTGYFLPYLSKAVGKEGRVVAVDIEPDMIRYMNERIDKEGLGNAETLLAAPDDPRLAAGSMDRVLIVDTWHHIADRSDYTRKLRTMLRPGGEVYIVDFTLDSPHGPPRDHRLEPSLAISELEAGGMKAEQAAANLPHQWVVRARNP